MNLSEKTRTRLAVLNAALWLVTGIAALSLLPGPRGLIETTWKPVQRELGGWVGLALGAAGITAEPLAGYQLRIEPRVFRAAQLMGRPGPVPAAASDRWWFPARFVADGVGYPVDLRFAGLADADRPLSERSWRVRFRGERRYRGVRELLLSPAREPHDALDLVVRDDARERGLLAPPAGFASLEINGAAAGTFFWSEGGSPAMLERLGYPDGELLTASVGSGPGRRGEPADLAGAATAPPRPDPGHRALDRLLRLVRSDDDGTFDRQLPEILDVEKFLTWNALSYVYGRADAGSLSDPLSDPDWYFDPVTGLLEPVVRSVVKRSPLPRGLVLERPLAERLSDRMLAVPAFRARRNAILWSWVEGSGHDPAGELDAGLGAVLTRLARAEGSLLRFQSLRSAAGFRHTVRTALRDRLAGLAAALATSEAETTPRLAQAGGAPLLTLEVRPAGVASLGVAELRFELGRDVRVGREPASIALRAPSGSLVRSVSAEPIVEGRSVSLRPEGVSVAPVPAGGVAGSPWTLELRLPFLDPSVWSRPGPIEAIEVVYRNEVTGVALPPADLLDRGRTADGRGDGPGARFRPVHEVIDASGLPLEVRGDELVLEAGRHRLDETLVVPRAVRLRIEPGTQLSLGPGVSIISFRGIVAAGTPDAPIVLQAASPGQPWGSLGVARAPEPSELRHVVVSGGSRARFEGIEFDGQLAFNGSDVVVEDCEVHDARDADGLSVKRAAFRVARSRFVSNGSDGLEAKWSHGRVSESLFANNADDGLDLADSEVHVEQSAFHWMGDKSISAGARSRVTIDSTRLSDSEIAIASKEDSTVDVRDTEIRRNELGFALYRDKPIFGGGAGTVTGGLFAHNARDFSVEPGSRLELNRVRRELASEREGLIGSIALRRVVTRSR